MQPGRGDGGLRRRGMKRDRQWVRVGALQPRCTCAASFTFMGAEEHAAVPEGSDVRGRGTCVSVGVCLGLLMYGAQSVRSGQHS